MTTRRSFLAGAGLLAAAGTVNRAALAALPEPVIQTSAATAAPLTPPNGRPYDPVVTLNGWTAPWRMRNGVKEFHLVAEREELLLDRADQRRVIPFGEVGAPN